MAHKTPKIDVSLNQSLHGFLQILFNQHLLSVYREQDFNIIIISFLPNGLSRFVFVCVLKTQLYKESSVKANYFTADDC